MTNRYFPRRIPLNPDARFHFALRRQKRRFYRDVEPCSVSLNMKNELIVGMLADIFKQPDWIVDWRLVEPANDIVRSQSGRRCRRVRLYLIDDCCLRREDEQLTH